VRIGKARPQFKTIIAGTSRGERSNCRRVIVLEIKRALPMRHW